MDFKCYRDWSELPQNSSLLFTKAEKESVFFSREWFESLTPHLTNQNQELLLVCVLHDAVNDDENNREVLAILPLLTNENREWSSFCHAYSSLFSLLINDKQQSEVMDCLCLGLKTLDFEYLTLGPIDNDDDNLKQLQNAMEKAGLNSYRNHKAYNWFHPTQKQSFSEYMAERPSKVRNTVLRKQRKLAREHNYHIQLFIDKNTQQALEQYHEIYKVSWKANEQYQALVEDVVKRFSKRGWTRLAILSIDNTPIAAQLWFVVAGKVSIFRLVYDQTWKNYSPGSILMTYLLQHVIDTEKATEIDFLSGNDKYKHDWMSLRRERNALVCVKKSEQIEKSESVFSKGLFTKILRLIKY